MTDPLSPFEAFAIFCAFTIGGGIMALPMAMSQSGWLLSIIVLCAASYYFFRIYSFLIGLMKQTAKTHMHIVYCDLYGQIFSLCSSVLISGHIYFLLCLMIIREMKLIRFLLIWTLNYLEFSWLSSTLGDLYIFKPCTVILLCFLLWLCGSCRGFKSFSWIPLLNLVVWIYFILLAVRDILFNDKIKTLSVPAYNYEETDEIMWCALEAFNSIQGFALLYFDVQNADVTRKIIKYGLWAALIISSSAAWLGSSYHLGNLNWLSMAHVGLGSSNLNETPFSWLIFIGLAALTVSFFISIMLVLNQVRTSLAHLIDYQEKHFHEETYNWSLPLNLFIVLLGVGALSFTFENYPLLITVRRIMLFIFCVFYPYLIYIKEDGPKLRKILYGLLIALFLVFVPNIEIGLKALISNDMNKEL
ncbi:unnamed protein product [Blepharisma stoltei]|uniref:Amino acid transporter transmembrane domain-containing protein n=1 Tax=Blepharisma stoltei TaxID=1481888 RepID=A0AAU9IG12_9CILI|nr:unnamed protein product [Blepharisma stoltei]